MKRFWTLIIGWIMVILMVGLTACGPATPQAPGPKTTPGPAPIASPASAPTTSPAPTPAPAQTQPAGLKLQIVSVNNPVKVDSDAKITVKTEPGAQCKITVWLSDGRVSGFPKDIEKTADANGNVEWLWQVTKHTLGGETKFEVSASLGGKSTTAKGVFTIDK